MSWHHHNIAIHDETKKNLYKFHVANLRMIGDGLERIARSARDAVSREDIASEKIFLRLYIFLMGAWAECRLKKLLYEPNSFLDTERSLIQKESSQYDQWNKTIELAFRKHYNIGKAPLSLKTLPHSAYSRYITLESILKHDLRQIIELRNTLAHGQWEYPFNSDNTNIETTKKYVLNTENILSLQFKKTLIFHLSAIIHDLVVSKATFERDFDKNFILIEQTRTNLQKRDYKKYADTMHSKLKRGKIKANKNINS